jgi:ammonium transporter Rh
MEPTSLNLNADYQEQQEEVHFDFFGLWILGIQVVIIVLFFVFCRFTQLDGTPYGSGSNGTVVGRSLGPDFFLDARNAAGGRSPNDVVNYWQFMRDVGVMIFIGFGYLMTFLKRHRFSAIGYTMFISVIVIEWNILVTGFYTYVLSRGTTSEATQISVGFPQMILGLFCAGSVLIAFGVWIGKIGPEQLLFMGMLQTVFYCTNAYVIEGLLGLRDVGGTMVIHMFGAYFGLAAGKFLSPPDTRKRATYRVFVILLFFFMLFAQNKRYAGASYTSDTFSMIGSIFLWLCWPSFNSALVPLERQYLAILNTFLSLVAATLMTFATSRLFRRAHHFTMEDLQNATLAGGVAMGASADILVSPGGWFVFRTVNSPIFYLFIYLFIYLLLLLFFDLFVFEKLLCCWDLWQEPCLYLALQL